MKRSTRMGLAKETVEILERGNYRSADGRAVDIAAAVKACVAGTRLFEAAELADLEAGSPAKSPTRFEVVNETTLAGISRLVATGGGPIAVLNFASAKNPGGGFLNGSEAQEESLARSSALHASLLTAWDFYERHRNSPSLLYSDAMIWSPGCPVIRNDEGELLGKVQIANFITSPAPNAGAAADNRPEELRLIPETLHRRAGYVLALAASQGCSRLILGAWGCGVFRNDPAMVAQAFSAHLREGAWRHHFEHVLFSVLDRSDSKDTFAAFQRAIL